MLDIRWPSSNDFEIPDLLAGVEPNPEMPFEAWGASYRRGKFRGTWHYYTDDYRFTSVWDKPRLITESGCAAIVEPNYSVFDQTPLPAVLWATYRKRWLARFCQEAGIGVWVDLNVSETHSELNLLGVPLGWKRFATRGYDARIPDLVREHGLAVQHAGGDVILIVYGGGEAVGEACKSLPGALWIPAGTAPRKFKAPKLRAVA